MNRFNVKIEPSRLVGKVIAPPSKSISHRALICAALAEGESVIYGTHRLEHKESNRAEAIKCEYEKLGIEVRLEGDAMYIRGGEIRSAEVDSHHDHRIAMSLAVSALRSDGAVDIRGAECVEKSYPDFFKDLEHLRVK